MSSHSCCPTRTRAHVSGRCWTCCSGSARTASSWSRWLLVEPVGCFQVCLDHHLAPRSTLLCLQITVVFDGLLESSHPDVAATVLTCAARLAAAVAPSASRSAAAAGQLEGVLHAVHSLLAQLNPPAAGAASQQQQRAGGPARSADQQRAVAAQLVQVVHAVYIHDVRLPRLQNQMMVGAKVEA